MVVVVHVYSFLFPFHSEDFHSTGLEPKPTVPPQDARTSERNLHTPPGPTGSRALEPAATHPGARPRRHYNMSPHPTRSCAPVPTVTYPCARPKRPIEHVSEFHEQSCSRAHCNISRFPLCAAYWQTT